MKSLNQSNSIESEDTYVVKCIANTYHGSWRFSSPPNRWPIIQTFTSLAILLVGQDNDWKSESKTLRMIDQLSRHLEVREEISKQETSAAEDSATNNYES
jgi:hypothetical protein